MRAIGRAALVIALLFLWKFSQPALGVPSLQLYGPGATYDDSTQSWLTYDDPFELWVVGAKTPQLIHTIDQLELFIAIPGYDEEPQPSELPNATLTIKTISSSDPVAVGNPDTNALPDWSLSLTASELLWGRPAEFEDFKGGGLPWHGTYPTLYWPVPLGPADSPFALDVNRHVDDGGEYAYNFTGEFDPAHPEAAGVDAYGDVQYYEITYAPYSPEFALHVDLIGFAHNHTWEAWRFAPFSHDADAAYTPEPATLILLATALGALAFRGMGRRKRERERV